MFPPIPKTWGRNLRELLETVEMLKLKQIDLMSLEEKIDTSELKSVAHEYPPWRSKIAVKVVDVFGNDTMTVVEVGG